MNTGPGSVLHVIPSLHLGGAEKTLVELLSDPSARKNASVAVLFAGGPLETRLADLGVPVIDLKATGLFSLWGATRRLARLIRTNRPQIVQSWLYYADLVCVLALKLSGLRDQTALYWGIRCSDHRLGEYHFRLRAAIWACSRFSHLPDVIVYNSNAGLAAHSARGYKPRRVEIIENGIDSARFHVAPESRQRVRRDLGWRSDEIVVVKIGRNDAQKGFDVFLDVTARFPNVRAVAVGKGTEILPRRENLSRLGVRNDIPDILAASDVVMSCSHYGEGFLNVVAEAMAAGRPVICTDVGDASRIVGEAGIVVPPRDIQALKKSLEELIDDPERREALGQIGRLRIQSEFPLNKMVSSFAELYESVASPA
jgi:glycosyltransferase involved in cell wall biosynthesis